jgi:hypothetical protein
VKKVLEVVPVVHASCGSVVVPVAEPFSRSVETTTDSLDENERSGAADGGAKAASTIVIFATFAAVHG